MKFNITAFILAFAIGMCIVYTFTPFPEIVVRYPRPHDFQNLRFEKSNGVCMEYKMRQVACGDAVEDVGVAEEKDTRVLQG
jgi:hypothetical protein